MKKQQPENLKRRGFLLAAGVGGAGAVAAIAVGAGKEVAQLAPSASDADKAGRYTETPHISNYYRRARV